MMYLICLYLWYYAHTPKASVSPIWGIFSTKQNYFFWTVVVFQFNSSMMPPTSIGPETYPKSEQGKHGCILLISIVFCFCVSFALPTQATIHQTVESSLSFIGYILFFVCFLISPLSQIVTHICLGF